jgi:hypothetical protein
MIPSSAFRLFSEKSFIRYFPELQLQTGFFFLLKKIAQSGGNFETAFNHWGNGRGNGLA